MKTLLLSVITLQVLYFPAFVWLVKRGFVAPTFKGLFSLLHLVFFTALLFVLPKEPVLMVALMVYGFVLLDEVLLTDYITKVFDKAFGIGGFVPCIEISLFKHYEMQFKKEKAWMVYLFKCVKTGCNPFREENADYMALISFRNCKWYEFLRPGNYGQEILKGVALLVLVIFL